METKKMLSLVVIIGLLVIMAAGCSLVGSGPIVEKKYSFKDFSEIEISHYFEYDITPSNNFSLAVSTHENLIESLDISLSGPILKIGFKPGNIANADAKAVITLPELERLKVSGASKGKAAGFSSEDNFKLEVSGASQAEMEIEAGDTEIEISGASKVRGTLKADDMLIKVSGASNFRMDGSGGRTRIDASGASSVDIPDLVLGDVSIKLSGASNAAVNTQGIMDVDLSGASTLDYYGNPRLGKIDISGASNLHQK
ncbi:MAG: DUF2807 domain-containing protein [Dehalococcoidales bacterium]|nr:DUF2807 domain-containing protein [Dehalococcoidales bacterium]